MIRKQLKVILVVIISITISSCGQKGYGCYDFGYDKNTKTTTIISDECIEFEVKVTKP